MNMPVKSTANRVIFFDNLRFLFVLSVVLQHASMAYMNSGWWPVTDEASLVIGAVTAFFDGFLMPSLFFISGYFAVPSIQNKSISQFIKGKLKRLGLPWLVCTLFIAPIVPLVYHYTRNGLTLSSSYRHTWQAVMDNAIGFDVGILPPMRQVMQNDLFYQRYMWFIGLLIAFFLVFSFIYTFGKSWFESTDLSLKAATPSVISTMKMMLSIGIITFLGSTLLIMTMFSLAPEVSNPEAWFTLGNFVQFRVSRIFLHIVYFVLGVLTFKWKWIERGKFPGHIKTWFFAFVVVCVGYYSAYFLMMSAGSDEMEKLFGLLFWLCLNFFTITALGLSVSLGVRYWNRQTSLNEILATNSYNLYLSHYIFVIGFQLLLFTLPEIPVLLKFGLVSILSICCGCLISQYLIKPYPKITNALVIGLFISMVLFIHP
jgi:fucose 4-O-acetylase-like acetyltransferase